VQPPPDRGDLPGAWLQALGMLELGLVVGHAGQVRPGYNSNRWTAARLAQSYSLECSPAAS
jgi:hypothetical protein